MYKYTKRFTHRGDMPDAAGRGNVPQRKNFQKSPIFPQKKFQKRLHFKHICFIISTKEDENMTYNEILGVCMKRRNKSLRTMADNMGTTYQNVARMVNGRKNKDGKTGVIGVDKLVELLEELDCELVVKIDGEEFTLTSK